MLAATRGRPWSRHSSCGASSPGAGRSSSSCIRRTPIQPLPVYPDRKSHRRISLSPEIPRMLFQSREAWSMCPSKPYRKSAWMQAKSGSRRLLLSGRLNAARRIDPIALVVPESGHRLTIRPLAPMRLGGQMKQTVVHGAVGACKDVVCRPFLAASLANLVRLGRDRIRDRSRLCIRSYFCHFSASLFPKDAAA
jgi:hypothetical protein